MENNMRLNVASVCHVGKIREKNQDNMIINAITLDENPQGDNKKIGNYSSETPILFGVFDGMGGYHSGERASFLAAQTAKNAQLPCDNQGILDAMNQICMDANAEVLKVIEEIKGQVGTTASMLCFFENSVNLCNIGDSPIFRYRQEEGLLPIFCEHTSKQTAEKIFGVGKAPKKKYSLTQHIGIDPEEMIITPYTISMPTMINDQYLICSDGLTDMVSEERIAEILASKLSTLDKVSTLHEEALENGGKDNISIILIEIVPEKKKSILPILIPIALVAILGLGFLGYFMFFNKTPNEEPIVEEEPVKEEPEPEVEEPSYEEDENEESYEIDVDEYIDEEGVGLEESNSESSMIHEGGVG